MLMGRESQLYPRVKISLVFKFLTKRLENLPRAIRITTSRQRSRQ